MVSLLEINNLCVRVNDKDIINDLNININDGEIHAVMGPNGVGKSTLAKAIMGSTECQVISGDIIYKDKSIIDLPIEERSRNGIFLAMQTPIEIEGVTNSEFLKVALGSKLNKNIGL